MTGKKVNGVFLLGIASGILLGFGAGRLVRAVHPHVQHAAAPALKPGAATLLLLACMGVALGYLAQHLFEDAAPMVAATAAYLYTVVPLLRGES